MAPSMSRNGLVWISRYSGLVLINVAHMLSTDMEKSSRIDMLLNMRFMNPSLNPAGTVLAYVSNDWKVHVYSVVCDDDNGEISLHKCLILTEHHADKVMLLEDNILGIKTILKMSTFSIGSM